MSDISIPPQGQRWVVCGYNQPPPPLLPSCPPLTTAEPALNPEPQPKPCVDVASSRGKTPEEVRLLPSPLGAAAFTLGAVPRLAALFICHHPRGLASSSCLI